MYRAFRQTLRRLAANKTFTATAVVTLALGIAGTVAVFSVVKTVLLEPLPFEEPDRLVVIWHTAPGLGFDEVNQSAALHYTYLEHSKVFDSVAMWGSGLVSITGSGTPEEVSYLEVTAEFLPLLGVDAEHGRRFLAEDDTPTSPLTVLLSHDFWQRRFDGDPATIGSTIRISGRDRTILGVLPKGFDFLDQPIDLMMPIQNDRAQTFVGMFNYQGIGRLLPGVTIEQANEDIARLLPVAVESFPGGLSLQNLEEARFAGRVRPLNEDLVGNISQLLWVLFASVGLVFLIACANVANLFLVRAEARHQELAVRTALGASGPAIARQLLGESLMLGLFGGAIGLPLAFCLLRLLRALDPESLPRLEAIGISPSVALFAVSVSLLSGLLFGLLPAFRQVRSLAARTVEALKEGGRSGDGGGSRSVLRAALVVAQIAIGLVLLVGSGLMIRSFIELRAVEPGYTDPESVMAFRVAIPSAEVEDLEEVIRLQHRIVEGLGALPGVQSVGATSSLPTSGFASSDALMVEGKTVPPGSLPPIRRFKFITPRYLESMGIALIRGRDLSWQDIEERRRVAIVTADFAQENWGSVDEALGKRIAGIARLEEEDVTWREIIGVVSSIHDDGPAKGSVPIVYWPVAMDQFWGSPLWVQRSLVYAVKTERTDDPGLLEELQAVVWQQNPNLPVANVVTMASIHRRSMARASFAMLMLMIAASMALVIGSVGIYGVISYIVSQRTREFGVRLALGASAREVNGIVIRYGMVLSALGIVFGLIASGLVSSLLSRLLYGVEPRDPLTFAVVATALGLVALVACLLAGRRASRVDPVLALRGS